MSQSVRQLWTGLSQVSQLYSTVQNLDKEEPDPLFKLRKALDSLKEHIDKSPYIVQAHANSTLIALSAILDLSPAEQERILGNPRDLRVIVNPLRELKNHLQAFVYPILNCPQPDVSQIKDRIPAAEGALDGQIQAQQGVLAKVISFVAKRIFREGESLAQRFGGRGEQAFTFRHHPLLELRHLIGCFSQNAKYFLPEDREEQLKHTLEHLSFYSEKFGKTAFEAEEFLDIHDYVQNKLGDIKLSEHLQPLTLHITTYLRAKIAKFTIPTDEDFFLFLYEAARKSTRVDAPQRDVKEDKIAWAQQHLRLEERLQDPDIIWEAFAQYDEIVLMNRLYQKILGRQDCKSVKDLADNVDRVLLYFQHIPPSQAKGDVLRHLSQVLVSWVAFSRGWIETHASGSHLAIMDQLAKVHETINQEKYLDAIRLLKHEIEHGPMSHTLASNGGTVSPLKDFQNLSVEFDESLDAQRIATDTNYDYALDDARAGLSEIMSYYATFSIVIGQICRIPNAKSQEMYNRIIAEVQQNPDSKTRTFFSLLASEINQLSEVSYFFRLLAKLLMFPIYAPIRLFANHTTVSALHFVKHYIELPSKEPLGRIHISPFEKFTGCFQANIGGMNAWAEDQTCEKFGATKRDEALKKVLRNPKFNNNYEREELVTKSGLLATDLFVNISHLQEAPAQLRRNITYNVNRPFFPIAENHILNSVAYLFKSVIALTPQLAVEILYYACSFLDFIFNSMIKWGAKRILVAYDLPNKLFKSLSNSLYNSQYIPVFDEIILKQFQLIEKVIDEESSGSMRAEKESNTTREIIKEMIENLFEMIEMRHNLTKSKMRNPRKDDIPFVDEHTRNIVRGLLDDNLSETLVNLLITLIQSLFNENRMNDFLLNLIRAMSTGLSTQESILTEADKEELKATRGYLSESIIKDGIKNKCYKQELAIHETVQRIIQKSVHQVVQSTTERAKRQRAALEYIDWIERTFYGAERGNFLSGMRQKIEEFKKRGANREDLMAEMQRDFRAFMRELEQKQLALDSEPIAQTRRLQRFANTVLLPNLQKLTTELRQLAVDHNSFGRCELALSDFNEALLKHKTHFRSIQAVELERKHHEGEGFSGTIRMAWRALMEKGTPVVTKQAEEVITRKLNNFAQGVLALPKNSPFTESLICSVALVPFLEANGVSPDLRFTRESQIIRDYD